MPSQPDIRDSLGECPSDEPRGLDLPCDFIRFLSTRAGVSYEAAQARLGAWVRDQDFARHGRDRLGACNRHLRTMVDAARRPMSSSSRACAAGLSG